MQRIRPLFLAPVFVGLALSAEQASAQDGAKVAVEKIELRLFSHEDGGIHPFNKPPNLYGMHMDIMVVVKLKGKLEYDKKKPSHVLLKIDAKGWSDAATGSHKSWRLERKTELTDIPEGGVRHILFIVPYEACYPAARFAVSVVGRGGGAGRTQTANLGCAE